MSHLDDGQVIKRSGTGLKAIFQRKFVQKKPREKPKEAEKPSVKPKEAEKPREKPKERKQEKKEEKKEEKKDNVLTNRKRLVLPPSVPSPPRPRTTATAAPARQQKDIALGDQSWRVRDNVLTNRKRLDLKSIPLAEYYWEILTNIPSDEYWGTYWGTPTNNPYCGTSNVPQDVPQDIPYCGKLEAFSFSNVPPGTSNIPPYIPYCATFTNSVSEIETPYKPKLVSIGPFHHKSPHLQPMEEHKLRIRNNCSTSEQTLAVAMRQLEVKTRNFYSEIFNEIDSGTFVDMMILDGCFLIELLRLYETIPKGTVNDNHYFPAPFSLRKLQCDLLMLENQLPMFVLKELFDLTSQGNEPSLAELALKFFDPLLHRGENFVTKLEVRGQQHHLLSLFHSSFLPSHSVIIVTPDERCHSRHSAKKLTDTGIVLEKSGNRSLLDIEFNRGVLKIPTLHLCRDANSVLLNLIDYEKSALDIQKYFTDYVSFLSSLLQTKNDFEVLEDSEIVELKYQEDVPRLFSNLCKEIDYYDFDNSYLCDQLSKLNKYYNQKWHGWKAECVRDYCSTPWKFLSLVTVILLLVLTFVQTLFTVLAYFRPPS